MTVVETFLVLAMIPAAIFGLVALLTLWPKFIRPRYRAGKEWDFAPVFWVANPAGVTTTSPDGSDNELESAQQERPSTARGGARGNW